MRFRFLKSYLSIILFACLLPNRVLGQSPVNSIQKQSITWPPFGNAFTSDSLKTRGTNRLNPLDSLKLSSYRHKIADKSDPIYDVLNKRTDSLRSGYERNVRKLDVLSLTLRKELDSLTNHGLQGSQVAEKLDSLTKHHEDLKVRFEKKLQDMKNQLLSKITDLNLPPEVAEMLRATTDDVKITSLTNLPLRTPSLDSFTNPVAAFNRKEEFKDPTLLSSSDIADNVRNLDITEELGDASQLKDAPIPTDNISDVEALSKAAEEKATDISGIKEIEKQTESLNQYKDAISKPSNQDSIKEMAIAQLRQVAVNHFAGKEQVLQEAMETMSKYKKKYTSVVSISELPKKRPNEMRGKPFIERIIPGIAMQIHKQGDDFMVDFNAYAAYRFTRKMNGGIGWNQRGAYNMNYNGLNANVRIFGPRVFGEYNLWKGFFHRAELELMNTNLPPVTRGSTPDPLHREWVWGAFVGLKKEYRIIRNIKGTAMVMTRLFNPDNKSPYADVLNVRFGFEFPVKKKASISDTQ